MEARRVSAYEARVKFGEILDAVRYRKEPIVVEKNGRAAVVILDLEAYQALEALRAQEPKEMPDPIEKPQGEALRWVAGKATPAKTYITRVFNFGTWKEWQAMKRDFSSRQIRQAVLHPLRGQWTPRGKALAEALFDCKLPENVLIRFDA